MKLTDCNPWWEEGGLWQDPDLGRVRSSPLKYRPQVIPPQSCRSPVVLTLRGPRRVGKTVTVKLLIADLIERQHWNPREILWLSFDTVRTLAKAEELIVDLTKQYSPRLLAIDEVTALIGWQRVIKKLRDSGILAEVCVILTGSSSYDLKAGAERMAGRRGDVMVGDHVLLPLSYGDFRRQLIQNQIRRTEAECAQMFLRVGGFPHRVEAFVQNELSGQTRWDDFTGMQTFDDVFFYEITRRRLDRTIALEILGRLAAIKTCAVSYEGFSKSLSIAKETARKYLDALGDSFLLATISSYDTSRGRIAPKKDRKFMWIDPVLSYLPSWVRQGESADEASRAEWLVGAELLRRFEGRLWEGLSAPRNVFTWKSSGGNEVDYLVVDRSRKLLFPVEVKYQQSISDWDFQVIERAFGRGWLVTAGTDYSRSKTRALSVPKFFEEVQLLDQRQGGAR